MKHKRGDLWHELRHLNELQDARERNLFIHRSVSIAIVFLAWMVFLLIFGGSAIPVIPIFFTMGAMGLYMSHEHYYNTQTKRHEKLENQMMQMFSAENSSSEFEDNFKRLTDEETLDDNQVYDETSYQQNSTY